MFFSTPRRRPLLGVRDRSNEVRHIEHDDLWKPVQPVDTQLNDAQRAQAALVTVLPSQPAPSPLPSSPSVPPFPSLSLSSGVSSPSSPSSASPTSIPTPSVLKIVLPTSPPHSTPQIRRIPLPAAITLPQLMASVMSVCQLSDPFLLRWDGTATDGSGSTSSVLLKRDEQLRAAMDEFGRSSGGGGGGGGSVFKLHVVHKSRRSSRSSTDSLPASSSAVVPAVAETAMSASVPSLAADRVRPSDEPSLQLSTPRAPSISSTTQHPLQPAAAVEPVECAQEQKIIPIPPTTPSRVVLLVDDTALLQYASNCTLTCNGWQVVRVSDSDSSAQRFKQHYAELRCILINVALPGLDALTATRRIRHLETVLRVPADKGVPIYAMSYGWTEQQLQSYEEAGMNGCLFKGSSRLLLDVVTEPVEAAARWRDLVHFPRNASPQRPTHVLANQQQASTDPIIASTTQLQPSAPLAAVNNNSTTTSALPADKTAAPTTACCTCAPLLSQMSSQLTQLTTQMAAIQAAPVPAAPPATCYSETALLTLTAMVESLTAQVESLSTQLQEAERHRQEAESRRDERRMEREARQSEREADREQERRERERAREEERSERKAEREAIKLMRDEERKEREADRRQRDAERREQVEQLLAAAVASAAAGGQQPAVAGEHGEGEAETDEMFAAANTHPASPALSAVSAPSFASSQHSDIRQLGDQSPSLSEEELDVLAPMLESARQLSPSSSAYFLCPPASTPSTASAPASAGSASAAAAAPGTRLDVMLNRLESEGYGVRSLNALVVSEHGGEDADWNVVVRDLDLYYAQG